MIPLRDSIPMDIGAAVDVMAQRCERPWVGHYSEEDRALARDMLILDTHDRIVALTDQFAALMAEVKPTLDSLSQGGIMGLLGLGRKK